jgi:hypothetical protein
MSENKGCSIWCGKNFLFWGKKKPLHKQRLENRMTSNFSRLDVFS